MPLPSFRMGQTYGATTTPFTPTSLFASGEQGVWYDPSDFIPNWRRNLLTYTEQFDNVAWTKVSANVTSNITTAPDGTLTADLIVAANGAPTYHGPTTNVTLSPYQTYTNTFYAKSSGILTVALSIDNSAGYYTTATFNLSSVTSTSSTHPFTADSLSSSILAVGNGWYKCTFTFRYIAGMFFYRFKTSTSNSSVINDGVSGVYLWGAQLEKGSVATTYQQITDGLSSDYLRSQPLPILYQDLTGTIPVYGVEQPVGLMLDKSKGLVLGSELITNGDFSNGTTGWASSSGFASSALVVSGEFQVTATSAYGRQIQSISCVVGRTYKVSCTARVISGTVTALIERSSSTGSGSFGAWSATASSSATTLTLVFTATGTTEYICIGSGANGTGQVMGFDNISVKEVPGNHAKAPADGNRPTLSARVNLLTYTEDFSNAVWGKIFAGTGTIPVVTSNFGLSPVNTYTASRVVLSKGSGTTSSDYSLVGSPTLNLGVGGIGSIYVKSNTGLPQTIMLYVVNSSTTSIATIIAGNTWQRLSATLTTAITAGGVVFGSRGTFGGDDSLDILVWGADLRPTNAGSLLPTYQRVNAATDYDTVGFPLYLKCNGLSVGGSSMYTNSIDFTATNKMTVVTGLRNLGNTASVPLEFSFNLNNNNGSWNVVLNGLTAGDWIYDSRGNTIAAAVSPSTYSPPLSKVLTGQSAISTQLLTLRLNGSQVISNPASQGSGNYGNFPLYLLSRKDGAYSLNGNFYGAIIRGETTSTPILLDAENYIATKTGITF